MTTHRSVVRAVGNKFEKQAESNLVSSFKHRVEDCLIPSVALGEAGTIAKLYFLKSSDRRSTRGFSGREPGEGRPMR